MSRHTIPGLRPGFTVVVGWDNPLDPVVLWLGTQPNQGLYSQDLIVPLAPYAILTDDTIEQLRADRAACLDRSPTTSQRACLAFVRRARSSNSARIASLLLSRASEHESITRRIDDGARRHGGGGSRERRSACGAGRSSIRTRADDNDIG